MRFIELIKDIIAPKKCYSCKREGHFLCVKCSAKAQKEFQVCYVCKKQSYQGETHFLCKNDVFYDQVIIGYEYNRSYVKKLIHSLKFYRKKDIAGDLVQILTKKFEIDQIDKENTYIVYPPIGIFKYFKRGYNQAELMAEKFSEISNISIEKSLFKLSRHKRQQSRLNKKTREENIKDSFKINKKKMDKIDNNNFIIIDDVISTGATLNELSKLLKQKGANKVIAIIFSSN